MTRRRNIKKPVPLFFVAMVLVFAMGGCAKPTPTGASIPVAENAEIGKTIRAQDFEITLIDAPETATKVGSDVVGREAVPLRRGRHFHHCTHRFDKRLG